MATADPIFALIVGHKGLLGGELLDCLRSLGEVVGVDQDQCDIRDPAQIEAVFRALRPDWVINTAAYTDVDGCETHRELARAVNVQGAGNLARACNKQNISLVHLSTDFIFDGEKGAPYTEEDIPHPLNVYGETKWDGEREVQKHTGHYLIIRTAWLFGREGRNFPETILKNAETSDSLSVVSDQTGSPTYVTDLAQAIRRLIEEEVWGIVNVTNRGSCSWYEYAVFILKTAGVNVSVIPISSDQSGSPARRPRFSVLDPSKYQRITGHRMRSWSEAVRDYLRGRSKKNNQD